MSTVLIVPGLNGSDENHWQSHWERRLPDTLRVQQDDWSTPNLALWSEKVVQAARGKKDLWIVAHSFGVLATVHALSHIADQVQGVFLVAPADPHKFGLQGVLTRRVLPVKGALVASHSDPWLSWAAAVQMADNWYLPLMDAGAAGHINVASGHHEWKQGLQWFESLRRSTLDIRQELFVIGEHFSYADHFRIAI